jgi:hypothetical protein
VSTQESRRAKPGICDGHRAEWVAWLDARPGSPMPRINVIGSPHRAVTAATEFRRSRADDWAATVRHAQGLIEQDCAARCREAPVREVARASRAR